MGAVVIHWAELKKLLSRSRAEGKVIVSTNGVFDVLHVGHIRYLQTSRCMGDILVAAINSDESVRRLKGPARPFVTELERAEILAALSCVDFVTIFDQDTPIEVLDAIRPDIHTKGGDYNIESMPETQLVRGYGGRIELIPYVAGRSSSRLAERIKAASDSGENR